MITAALRRRAVVNLALQYRPMSTAAHLIRIDKLESDSTLVLDLLREMKKDMSGLTTKVSVLNTKVSGLESATQANTKSIEQLARMLTEIRSGLGVHFEKFNAAWVKELLVTRNPALRNVSLDQGRLFFDKARTVVPGSNEFGIDLFSANAAIVVEATTYLRREESEKWQRLVRIRKYFEEQLERDDVQVILVCLAMDPKIGTSVVEFCAANNVTLIAHYG